MPAFLLEIIKKVTCFSRFELHIEISVGHFSISLVYKTLRAAVGLFFSNIFQSFVFYGYFILSKLYKFMNGLLFKTLCGSFSNSLKFNANVAA